MAYAIRRQTDSLLLFEGDCREIIPYITPAHVSLLLTDPPYGISLDTRNKSRQRGSDPEYKPEGSKSRALTSAGEYAPVYGDDEPFDPSHLLGFPRAILFGANYYAERLPASPSWLIWDKLAGLESKRELGFNNSADVELAWTNLGGPARLIPHRWMGIMKGSEHGERRVHPTQKPVALMRAIIEHWTQPGDWIFDPYAGSGSTLRAALAAGRRVIGCELSPEYCGIILDLIDRDQRNQ